MNVSGIRKTVEDADMRCLDCGVRTEPLQRFCSQECLESYHAYEHQNPEETAGECELCRQILEDKEEDRYEHV